MGFLKKIFEGGAKTKADLFMPPPPPSDAAIAGAESALNIKFPVSFVSFMRESCAMRLPLCAQFYWVGDESLGMHNIVAANRQEHEVAASPLPEFLVAFYDDGMGNQVCFDARRYAEGGEYPIVFWDHELDAEENMELCDRVSSNRESAGTIASSFPEWWKNEREAIE